MSFVIEHNFEIDAPPEIVWEVITDTDSYGEWNPFVHECQSTLKPGDTINMRVQIGRMKIRQTEIMSDYREGEGFAYCMKPAPLGALSSQRQHRIEAAGDGRSRYHSRFQLDGWMAPLVKGLIGSNLRAGFDGMSEGVRDRAQALARERGET